MTRSTRRRAGTLALALLAAAPVAKAGAQGWHWGVNLDSSALAVASRDVWRGHVRSPGVALLPRVALDLGGSRIMATEGTSLWLNAGGRLPVSRRDDAGSSDQLSADLALRHASPHGRFEGAVGYREYAFVPSAGATRGAGELLALADLRLHVPGLEEAPVHVSAEGNAGLDGLRDRHHLRAGLAQGIKVLLRQRQLPVIVDWSADTHLDDGSPGGRDRPFRFRGEEVTLGVHGLTRGAELTRNVGIRFGGLLTGPLKRSTGWAQVEASWVL